MARVSRAAPGRPVGAGAGSDGNGSLSNIAKVAPRIIAEFNDYAGLIAALRARAHERRIAITSADVAQVAGLPDHYLAKLLSVHPVKRIGAISMGPVLSVLGVKLQLIEDREALARYASKIPQRSERAVHSSGVATTITRTRAFYRKIGRKGAIARSLLQKKRQQQTLAARMARWK